MTLFHDEVLRMTNREQLDREIMWLAGVIVGGSHQYQSSIGKARTTVQIRRADQPLKRL